MSGDARTFARSRRFYTAAEAPLTSAGARVAVIRHRFWQRMFGGDPAAIGKRIRTEGVEVEIIGILPPGFEAILGVILALVGLYALLAYTVAQRTRELGVRVAVGATRGSVLMLVIRDAVLLTLTGAAIGVPLALWPAKALESLLYGISPADPSTLIATGLFFVTLGVVGGLGPAWRAATVDPVAALRAE